LGVLKESKGTMMPQTRAALVMAHPGHELRVYQWLSLTRPLCFVLTDGSGASGKSRLNSTTRLLQQNGARIGSIYGRMTDREIYSAIINGKLDLFVGLTEELTGELVREDIEYVVGDAIEGYNPVHDVCRFMIDAAVEIAGRIRNQPLPNFEVGLASQRPPSAEPMIGEPIRIDLDEAAVSRKLEAARSYLELAGEVEEILKQEGIQTLQTEWLQPVASQSSLRVESEPPYYELHGEKRVAAGNYQKVLRYREHVLPIVEALRDYSQNYRQ
jgi:hypothetical protein